MRLGRIMSVVRTSTLRLALWIRQEEWACTMNAAYNAVGVSTTLPPIRVALRVAAKLSAKHGPYVMMLIEQARLLYKMGTVCA